MKIERVSLRTYVYRCTGCGKQFSHHHGGLTVHRKCEAPVQRLVCIDFHIENIDLDVFPLAPEEPPDDPR